MEETITDFILAMTISIAAWFFGGVDGFLRVLITMSVIDYFSGVSVAWYQHKLSSRIGFKGILKKCVMFSLVGVSNIIGELIGGSDAVRTVVILFYIGNEGMSIMENAYTLGVPFPKALRDRFEQFRDNDKDTKAQKEVKDNGSIRDNDQGDS